MATIAPIRPQTGNIPTPPASARVPETIRTLWLMGPEARSATLKDMRQRLGLACSQQSELIPAA